MPLSKFIKGKSKEWWENHWKGMPEFVQEDNFFKTINVHFKDKEGLEEFEKLVKQKITMQTKFIWFPKVKKENLLKFGYIDSKDES